MRPDHSPGDVVSALRGMKASAAIALVGHEPQLSQLEGLLLTGTDRAVGELRKGGAALLESPPTPAPGKSILLWHLTPAQLRELGA